MMHDKHYIYFIIFFPYLIIYFFIHHYRVVIWFLSLLVTPDWTTPCLSERRRAFWRSLRPSCCASGPTSPASTKWRYVLKILKFTLTKCQKIGNDNWQSEMNLTPTECPAEGKRLERTLYLLAACHSLWWLWKQNASRRKIFTPVSAFVLFLPQMSHWIERNCMKYMFLQMLFEKCWFKNRRVSLCCNPRAALRGDVKPGQGEADTAVLLSHVHWPTYGPPLVHWITSGSSQCVWFMYLLASMWELVLCVCVYMWSCECAGHTAVHWLLWPLLESLSRKFCMAGIFDPMPSHGSLQFCRQHTMPAVHYIHSRNVCCGVLL